MVVAQFRDEIEFLLLFFGFLVRNMIENAIYDDAMYDDSMVGELVDVRSDVGISSGCV